MSSCCDLFLIFPLADPGAERARARARGETERTRARARERTISRVQRVFIFQSNHMGKKHNIYITS